MTMIQDTDDVIIMVIPVIQWCERARHPCIILLAMRYSTNYVMSHVTMIVKQGFDIP